MSTELNLVGKYTGPDTTILRKVTGTTQYGADYNRQDQAYMEILSSTQPHATVTVDASKVLAMKGVLAVMTPEDFKDSAYRMSGPTMMILPYDKVRFAGEEVAAVVAEDPYTAKEALTQFNVTYSPLKFVLDPIAAQQPGAPEIHPGGNIVRAGPTATFVYGDTAKGFTQSDQTIEGTYTTSTVQHNNVGTHAGLVEWVDGRLHLWTSTQYMHGMRNGLAAALGIADDSVVCHSEMCDGGFGDKSSVNRIFILAAMLSQKIGRPVKFRESKEQNLLQGVHRYMSIVDIKMGVKNDGTVQAVETKITCDAAAYYSTASSGIALELYSIYKFPNFKHECWDVYTNTSRDGAYRCVADPIGVFTMESHMNKVAEQLGMDPIEFRKKNNMYTQGDTDQLTGNRIPSCGQPKMLDKAAQLSGWSTKYKSFVKGSKPTGVVHGIGVSNHSCAHGSGSFPNAAVIVMNPDGSALVHTGASEIGESRTIQLALIVAEHLGLPLEKVAVANRSTDDGPDSGGTYGSRQTKSAGNACAVAALDVKDQLFTAAAGQLGVKKEELSIGQEKVFVTADPTKSVTVQSLVSSPPWIIGRGQWTPPGKTTQRTYATHIAEVDVDTDTGIVKVTRYVAVHDIGRRIFTPACDGQVHGGVMQGIDYTLMVELLKDAATGKPYNASYLDHKMSIFTQTPNEFVVDWVEEPEQPPDAYQFGAKGLGEPPTSPPGPAIANAIANAIGVHIDSLPITPEKILKALGKA